MTGLVLVHWLHVAAALVWGGGIVVMAVVIWPILLRRPATEAKAFYTSLGPTLGPRMGVSGLALLVLGAVRGVVYGPIDSFADLGSPYGLTFVASAVATIALVVAGGRLRGMFDGRVWSGDDWAPGAARFVHTTNAVTVAWLGGIVLLMNLMRFGI